MQTIKQTTLLHISTVFIWALCVASSPARADVTHSSEFGFVIEISAESDQSVEASYQQFLKIGEWWDGDHSWFGSAKNFYLEPRVGGCFCEVEGDKQALHMTVSFIEPNKEVRLLGGLGPLQMMGVDGAMSWSFAENEEGRTLITHRYTVTGYHKDGLDKLAPIVDKVQANQLARLIDTLKHTTDN